MNSKKIIPIFFATDDLYVPFLSVAIESLKAKAKKENTYHIHVLYSTLTKENMNSLIKYNEGNLVIFFDNVDDKLKSISDKLLTRDYYTKAIYFRLFIAEMFPQYSKAIYLDCDVALNSDITELFNIELGDNLLGAAADGIVQVTPIFINYVERFLKVEAKSYFNSGVLLLNLKAMRNEGFEERFINFLNRAAFIVAPDQDYLNIACKGRVTYLPAGWNKMPIPLPIDPSEIKLVHYNLAFKPWHHDDILHSELFWTYALKSVFYKKIRHIKDTYSNEEKLRDKLQGEKLISLAKFFSECNKTYDEYDFSKDSIDQKKYEEFAKTLI